MRFEEERRGGRGTKKAPSGRPPRNLRCTCRHANTQPYMYSRANGRHVSMYSYPAPGILHIVLNILGDNADERNSFFSSFLSLVLCFLSSCSVSYLHEDGHDDGDDQFSIRPRLLQAYREHFSFLSACKSPEQVRCYQLVLNRLYRRPQSQWPSIRYLFALLSLFVRSTVVRTLSL